MVIDFHTHTYPDKIAIETVDKLSTVSNTVPYSNGTAKDLSDKIKEAGIDYAVVLPVATAARQVEKINTFATLVHTNYPNLISFGAMHPEYENYKDELFRIKELGLKGIKLHPDYQGCFFDDIRYCHIMEEAFKLGLIVTVHAGVDIGLPNPVHTNINSMLNVIHSLCLKDEKLILAHTGGWRLWDQVLDKIAGENVYFDTSFTLGDIQYKDSKKFFKLIDDDLFVQIVRKHGANRILFATDSPWGGHREMLAKFISLPLSQEEKELILYKNAKALLKIEQ